MSRYELVGTHNKGFGQTTKRLCAHQSFTFNNILIFRPEQFPAPGAASLRVALAGTGAVVLLYLDLLIFSVRNDGQSLYGPDAALQSSELFPTATNDN